MPVRHLFSIMLVASLAPGAASAQTLPLEQIKLPPGFTIELVARVPSAREMTFGANGTLFVGSVDGSVYAVADFAGNAPRPPAVHVIASGLREPAGVAFRNGALYVSAVSQILRFDDIERRLDNPPSPVVVTNRFPTEGHHGRKFIAFGPDGKLYVPVGAPCNICEPDRDRYANIMRMNADGSNLRGRRARHPQQCRLRLGSSHARAVVHEQRARHDGRRCPARYAEP